MMRPPGPPDMNMPEEEKDRIMHVSLAVGSGLLIRRRLDDQLRVAAGVDRGVTVRRCREGGPIMARACLPISRLGEASLDRLATRRT